MSGEKITPVNILTKNRILEQGDEYRDKSGDWKPVPPSDFGLQIMFTHYAEVRRPSENGAKPLPAEPVKATPAPERKPLHPSPSLLEKIAAIQKELKTLPTVVSKKAHVVPPPPGKPPQAIPANEITIAYPLPNATRRSPIWTGRNGTFVCRKLNIINGTGASEGIIKIIPEGKRGMARNAVIEFPASIIPQLVDFLLRHQPPPTTK